MSARQKLNLAHFTGILLTAGLLGWGAQSLEVTLLVAAGLFALQIYAGTIRPDRSSSSFRGRRRRRR